MQKDTNMEPITSNNIIVDLFILFMKSDIISIAHVLNQIDARLILQQSQAAQLL